jgi:hypothetical protein
VLLRLYLVLVFLVLATFATASLGWRIVHDSPLMLYTGYLLDLGLVPYVDFFDMNPPGTHLLNWLVYRAIADSDLEFRALELLSLAVVGGAAWLYLRPFGRAAALAAPQLYVIHHLSLGPYFAFQREDVCTVCLALSLLVAFRTPRWPLSRRAAAIGFLAGAISVIKPQLVLPMPLLVLGALAWELDTDWRRLRTWRALVPSSAAFLAGLAVIPVVTLAILAWLGGLGAFLDMASHYWPLYSQLRGDATLATPLDHAQDVLRVPRTLCSFAVLGPAAIGLALAAMAVERAPQRARVEFFTLLAVAGALLAVVGMAGKLWTYHFFPAWLLLSLAAGLSLARLPRESDASYAARILVVAFFTLPVVYRPPYLREFLSHERVAVKDGDPDEIAQFLREHLRPGDLVQPLDVTDGAVHGMLLARARLATPFLYDFHFYHHPDDPYIRALRERLTTGIEATCARFVIRFRAPWRPSGPGTASDFPALDAALASYDVALSSRNFEILERRPGCVPRAE